MAPPTRSQAAAGLLCILAPAAHSAAALGTPAQLEQRRAAHVAAHAKQCADSLLLYPARVAVPARAPSRLTTRAVATGGGGGDRGAPVGVLGTNEPVFSRAACDAVIAEAEAAAAAASDGWSTTRHARHPAADIALERLPRTREWLAAELQGCLAPLLSEWFPALLPDPTCLRVVDGFVVRYKWEAGQIELPTHRDGSLLTLNVALNGDGAFDGGGTWVEHSAALQSVRTGAVIAHASAARHAGAPISRGTRYILVAFCISASDVEHGRRFLEEGVALAAAGRLAEAEGALRAALAHEPALQAAHFNLAQVLRARGEPARARLNYEAALALDGGLEASRYQEAILGLCAVLPTPAGALAAARRAVAADGASAEARLALAVRLSEAEASAGRPSAPPAVLGAFDEADARASRAEQQADCHHQRGRALFADGLLTEALGRFDLAVAADARVSQAHADRAVCLFELDRLDEALAAFGAALDLEPGNAQVREQGEAVAAYAGRPAFFAQRRLRAGR